MRPIIRTIIIQTAQDITSAGNLLNRCGLLAHTLFVVGEEGGVHTQQAYFFFFFVCASVETGSSRVVVKQKKNGESSHPRRVHLVWFAFLFTLALFFEALKKFASFS